VSIYTQEGEYKQKSRENRILLWISTSNSRFKTTIAIGEPGAALFAMAFDLIWSSELGDSEGGFSLKSGGEKLRRNLIAGAVQLPFGSILGLWITFVPSRI